MYNENEQQKSSEVPSDEETTDIQEQGTTQSEQSSNMESLRRGLHKRIWISGLIASAIFSVLTYVLESDTPIPAIIIQFFIFLGVWVLLHYFFLRKTFRQLRD